MLEHHIQKEILQRLVLGHSRFSELNPSGLDSNLYNYHLHQLIAHDYVEKSADKNYLLTEKGKAEGIHLKLNEKERLAQAHTILLLLVRDKTGRYLLRRRSAHPMFGKVGFIHGEPKADELLIDTAKRVFDRRTGMDADFKVSGSGFIRIFIADRLESFTSFTLLTAVLHDTALKRTDDETGTNFWTETPDPDFSDPDMLPSMADIVGAVPAHHDNQQKNVFFLDRCYFLKA